MVIFNKLIADIKAATSIEYAVIASCLSVVILGALLLVGNSNNDNYKDVANKVGDAIDNKPKTP